MMKGPGKQTSLGARSEGLTKLSYALQLELITPGHVSMRLSEETGDSYRKH